ncbi:hypothetical protein ADUPG1_014195 [Aduncisulcus paluster]|nr:hypothetical protein ADUPG1_014195 [Aduncisulcus paluster]
MSRTELDTDVVQLFLEKQKYEQFIDLADMSVDHSSLDKEKKEVGEEGREDEEEEMRARKKMAWEKEKMMEGKRKQTERLSEQERREAILLDPRLFSYGHESSLIRDLGKRTKDILGIDVGKAVNERFGISQYFYK